MEFNTFELKTESGALVEISNFGAIVTKLLVPDRNGKLEDVVLGFDTAQEYADRNPSYYGAIVGRFANRLAGASSVIDGKKYEFAQNDGPNALHGGLCGFDKVFWTLESQVPGKSVTLTYLSRDGEEGYPGNLLTRVTYSFTDVADAPELKISYEATTDKTTILNLTHHSYFNLSGDHASTVEDHELMIDADHFTVADDAYIPTGEIREVSGLIDFRKPVRLGERLPQLKEGFNHCYVLNHPGGLKPVASVHHAKSGRTMTVTTTEPGLMFYSAHFLDQTLKGKGGVIAPPSGALCLEAQHFPDSPHHPSFPTTELAPGETYRQTTAYRFYSGSSR
jgi:aldose 1-epimerase